MVKHYDYTISLVRVLACILIVWNHLSNFMLDGFLNGWNWANIGVQVFFFMSGYLYGGRIIHDRKAWLIKQTKKIVKPYYLYLLFIIPVIYFIDKHSLDILNVSSAFLCIQGFSLYQIDGLGQHWFVSYILICYLLFSISSNTLLFNRLNKMGGGKYWLVFLCCTILLQIITIPLAIFIKFKIAYVMTFFIGYCYKERFVAATHESEKRIWEKSIIFMAALGIVVRFFIENSELSGFTSNIADMTTQYIKMVWACAIFVLFNKIVPESTWENVGSQTKESLVSLSGITYEIYLVHEIFVHEPYISIFGEVGIMVKVFIALLSIVVATWLLCRLESITDRLSIIKKTTD